jgi:hypothetical protein
MIRETRALASFFEIRFARCPFRERDRRRAGDRGEGGRGERREGGGGGVNRRGAEG